MAKYSPLISKLIAQLGKLPGIGGKSAQRLAFTGAGYKIRKSILMHINNQYVRSGSIDVKQLFKLQDITNDVIEAQAALNASLPAIVKVALGYLL